MSELIDKYAKSKVIYPLRKAALAIAKHWPFPVRASLVNGDRMWVDLRSSIGRAILVKGQFDQAVWSAIEPRLGPGFVFIDVGANVGYYSMLASLVVGSAGRVHAFEIDPRPLRCLKANARECRSRNITVHETAIGASEGRAFLELGQDCGHSYVKSTGSGVAIPITSLDQWISGQTELNRVDVIKIDIEGGEGPALEGARALMSRFRPVVICEALDNANNPNAAGQGRLIALLQDIGYRVDFTAGAHSPTIVAEPQ
jgi:FkbM family methyltransferase